MRMAFESVTEMRFALIDLGSNSIRLVLYDRARPFAAPVLNEKFFVELGKNLESTGYLSADKIDSALKTFQYFKWLLKGLGITEVHIIATAAMRDAANADILITKIKSMMGFEIKILSGEEEARLSATGVLLGCPGAKGLVADLGGGSLELAQIGSTGVGSRLSLPLGILYLQNMGLSAARQVLEESLKQVSWLQTLDQTDRLYLVGGTWRALARAHMVKKSYPLNVVHRYGISTKALQSFATKLLARSDRRLQAMGYIPQNRRQKLPWAAMVAEALVKVSPCKRVVFSGAGLREGYSAALLGRSRDLEQPQNKRYDCAIGALIPDGGRFGAADQDLFHWMEPLFPNEKKSLRDRRLQACQLFDFGWEAHPSYRDIDIPSTVLHTATLTQSHKDRAYLGLVLLLRHGGNHKDKHTNPWLQLLDLLPKDHRRHAMITGRALRLVYKISKGVVPLLGATSLHLNNRSVTLKVHEPDLAMMPAVFLPTFAKLAETLALEPKIDTQAS